MALPPKFKGHRLLFTSPAHDPASPSGITDGEAEPLHTIEVYLDYVCPFSAKMFNTIYTRLTPLIHHAPQLAPHIQILFRPQIQPWHPSSTLVHEAALAVQRLAPTSFWAFGAALFAAQQSFFDVSVVHETRNLTYRRLARLAAETVPGLAEDAVYELLEVPDKPGPDGALNVGNGVTGDLKTVVKMARQVGVHVSPTVMLDGAVADQVSSGWSAEQWMEWLEMVVGGGT